MPQGVILAFCCHNYGTAAAEMAERYGPLPPGVHVTDIPCTGGLETLTILGAFENGADGVLVFGCPEGECSHINGSRRAKVRVEQTKRLLDFIGIGAARLEMHTLYGSQGPKFLEAVREMVQRVGEIGPNPLPAKNSEEGLRAV